MRGQKPAESCGWTETKVSSHRIRNRLVRGEIRRVECLIWGCWQSWREPRQRGTTMGAWCDRPDRESEGWFVFGWGVILFVLRQGLTVML